MKLMEYVGKIITLRGRTASVRPAVASDFPMHSFNLDSCVMARFDDIIWHGDQRLHCGWHPFSVRDFMEIKNGKQVF